ncbi:serine hydrolase domain-containing protein [Parapedobacter tibetensis]|uniref:serine hydrolase domain-containing protein n=1 Tax=Parapedobacter tibetensis TaxID=2972951 RepID=UPI00214D8EE6|nr:serine hydrolase domain-containing protein [Parapedobacter tibetensis]
MSIINKSIGWLLALFFLHTGFTHAQQADTLNDIKRALPTIDSIYRSFAAKYHSPGLAYAVVYRGDVVHMGTFGHTDIQQQFPVTPHSVFRIASMTKSFVAAAILQLRDAGQLRLDDPVTQYIPELGNQWLLTTDAPEISIRHLLTHSAGFPEDNPWGDRQLEISDEKFKALIQQGFTFSNAPGMGYEYSNTGYALLGEVIKRITGQRYDAYINTNLLQPLGMANTHWEHTEVPDSLLAKGYRWVNDQWVAQPMLHDGAYGAMGGLMSSLEDFAKYTMLFLDAWPVRDGADNGPLKRSSLREMQQPWTFNSLSMGAVANNDSCPIVSAYGYGLRWTRDCTKVTTVGHSGGLPGFGSNWIILPDYGLGVICFSNVTYAPTTAINANVIKEIILRSDIGPRTKEVSAILKQRQNELMNFLPNWADAEDSDVFAVNFFLDHYIDVLREESKMVFAKAGKVLKVNEIIAENNLRGTFIIECEHQDIAVYFTLSPESIPRIQQFSIKPVTERR